MNRDQRPGDPAMTFKLNKNDEGLLRSPAEYRVLTTGQVAVLIGPTRRAVEASLEGDAQPD